jgi:hypothetical protein
MLLNPNCVVVLISKFKFLQGPHKIQTFTWVATHERLLTNYHINKWGLGVSPICSACGNADETIIHVARDCVYAAHIWIS